MNRQQQISTNGKYHSYDIRTIDFIGHCMQCEIVRTNKRRVHVNYCTYFSVFYVYIDVIDYMMEKC